MKVLILNGSPKPESNTGYALEEMEKVFDAEGVEYEEVKVGDKSIRGCIDCRKCGEIGRCSIDDMVNETAPKLEEADALVIASPVYFAQPNATLTAFVQRLLFSTPFDKTMKVGASVVVARRGGCATAYDDLNKFFGIGGMPIAPSQYWNMIYGRSPGEVKEDEEGLQTMRTLARNIVFMMKCIALGKEQFGLPEKEETIFTHFIR